MIAEDTDLDALFKRLHLANARRLWRQLVDRAERESWSYRDFLALLATWGLVEADVLAWWLLPLAVLYATVRSLHRAVVRGQ